MHAFKHARANAPVRGRASALAEMYSYAGNYWDMFGLIMTRVYAF